jgi:hypothetical protein
MSALTDHAENLILDWLMTTGSATRPTAWYVALHTSAPSDASPSTGEISGNGYSRQSATFTVSGDTASNSADLTFGPNTTSNWGTVSHVSVWDASTSGNCLWHGALTASVAIAVNDELKISAGSLDLTMA